ncbi:hypothetical protein F66182_4415 [Fusarium sp. NRRL 66182]|nr:hypothetical protein F66182_4415 [Fusarium sp. NRRL 66182]
MRFAAIVSFLLPLVACKPTKPTKGGTISNNLIFDPPTNYTDPQTLYARNVELSDGTLLATWENYSPEPAGAPKVWFPIYQSKDGGKKWKEISRVRDTQNGWGLRYQPFLYELPRKIGKYPKGTVLISGSSIPTDLSQTLIEVYASRDKGYTWEFVSHVALGGEAFPNPGLTPVWEPFLMTYKKQLIIYYADQRDNATHSQKLTHQTTTDLVNWGEVTEDAKYPEYFDRPGMPTVARMPNDKYIYVYEYGHEPGGGPPAGKYWFPVYYKISRDPTKFLDKEDHQVLGNKGGKPAGSPYVVWTPYGGKNGTLVVSSGTMNEIFTNQALGDPSAWKEWKVPEKVSYTRSLLTFKKDPDLLLIMGGGILPPAGGNNNVTNTIVRLSEIMKE